MVDESAEATPGLPLDTPSGSEPLLSPDVGLMVVRGGVVRVVAYGFGVLLAGLGAVLLLRYLGVSDYGRYATVTALVAVVSGLTDAGLGAVGTRDLARRPPGAARRRLLGSLLGLRLVLTPVGVVAGVAVAGLLGFDRTLVLGVAIAGAGLVLGAYQATMSFPLYVRVRPTSLAAIDLLQQAVSLVSIGLLVAAGVGLLAFFAVPVVLAVASVAATALLVGQNVVWRPRYERDEWKALIHEVLPLAAASVMSVIYLRVLIILMSLLASTVETGLFAASFRITAMLLGLSSLALTVLAPVLAVAAEERDRLHYIFQRTIEVALIGGVFLAIVAVVIAEPVLVLLGGEEYRDAAPVLRIQVFALVPLFFGEACGAVLIAIRRQSVFVVSGAVSLVVVIAAGLVLIPLRDAIGAAIAAVIAETVLASVLYALLVRGDSSLRPQLRIVWKVLLAGGLALCAGLLLGLPVAAAAVLEIVVYGAVLFGTRAVPPEVIAAIRFRSNR
jgi:O-antigen/teichoic acid export membrane protein